MSDLPAPSNANYERAVRESFARQGLMGTIGAWLVDVKPGRVGIELPYSERVSQQHGLFHGAVIGAIGDNAGGFAAMTLMPADSEVLTVEYKINFLRPARGLLLRAEGQVIKAGQRLLVARMDVSVLGGEGEGLCAALQATMMRLEPPDRPVPPSRKVRG
jgi:uncharacterized protein (TIGR00369 family)